MSMEILICFSKKNIFMIKVLEFLFDDDMSQMYNQSIKHNELEKLF